MRQGGPWRTYVWHSETNTFFKRQSEMIVILEDVHYILIFSVFGRPLVGGAISNPISYFSRLV